MHPHTNREDNIRAGLIKDCWFLSSVVWRMWFPEGISDLDPSGHCVVLDGVSSLPDRALSSKLCLQTMAEGFLSPESDPSKTDFSFSSQRLIQIIKPFNFFLFF